MLDLADLANFTTHVEEPVSLTYHGYQVFKCGPWSQGPVFLQQLALLEGYDLNALGHNSAAYIHLVTEAAKLAFADREAYYGDPDFVSVPMAELLSKTYAAARRQPRVLPLLLRQPPASRGLRPATRQRNAGGGFSPQQKSAAARLRPQ